MTYKDLSLERLGRCLTFMDEALRDGNIPRAIKFLDAANFFLGEIKAPPNPDQASDEDE